MKKMHAPYGRFKGWLKENNVKYGELAELLGINVTTVTLKINGQSDFYLSEVRKMMDSYGLESKIFFTNIVA